MKHVLVVAGAAAALIAAGLVGYFVAWQSAPTVATHDTAATSQSSSPKILYWYDPMLPQQHFDHPGTSPTGMQMVPKFADAGGSANQDVVRIDPAVEQNLGVRSEVIKVGTLPATLHVPGTVAWDQRLAVTVSARTDSTLEKLYVRAPYAAVKAGQPLAEILAPQWNAAAAEYFALDDATSADARALRGAAHARLLALGMDDATIRGLRAGSERITLRAPIAGVVSELNAREGQQISAGMPIMSLNGLDSVWVDPAIPQAQSGGVGAGTPIVATLSALPGATFRSRVEELLPDVDPITRTRRARIVLPNPKHELAPGMFVDVRIDGAADAPRPLVPDEAVIADGTDTRVIQMLSDGGFKPVRVKTGRASGGMTEILAGLHGGERIVTSGQFLIDSEASLAGALERLNTGPKPVPAASNGAMPGMKMPPASSSSSSSPSSGAHP